MFKKILHFFIGHKFWLVDCKIMNTFQHGIKKREGDYYLFMCECGKVIGELRFNKPRKYENLNGGVPEIRHMDKA